MTARPGRREARRLEALVADLATGDRDLALRLAPPRPPVRTVGLVSTGLLGAPILLAGLAVGAPWLVAVALVVFVLPGVVLLVDGRPRSR